MRSRALFVVCLLAIAVTSLTKAQSSFLHLNPGGLSDLPETVPVNIVFVGYDPPCQSVEFLWPCLAGTGRSSDRDFYGVTEELGLRYAFDYHVTFTSTAWEDGFFAALSSLATPRLEHCSRISTTRRSQRARRGGQPLHRRSISGKVADRQRSCGSGHASQHDFLHQLVGTFGFQVSRLHEVWRAGSRYGLRLRRESADAQDHRMGAPPPTMRRRGLARGESGASGFTICPPDRRPGRTTGTSTTPMSTGMASRTTACRRSGNI